MKTKQPTVFLGQHVSRRVSTPQTGHVASPMAVVKPALIDQVMKISNNPKKEGQPKNPFPPATVASLGSSPYLLPASESTTVPRGAWGKG